MFLPIIMWGILSIICCTIEYKYTSLNNWPGFIFNLVTWYMQEFCYYAILIYWTSLDLYFALLIYRNFDSEVEMVKSQAILSTDESYREFRVKKKR